MASPSELSLDCKPHSYSLLLKSFGDHADQTQTLEEVLNRLEEERFKIDGLKRELPLCMQLLTNAMEFSRQQLQAYRANQGSRPVLEEFIPLKKSTSDNSDKSPTISDKANWMTTAQLWSQTGNETKPQTNTTSPKETDMGFNGSHKLVLDTRQRNGGAFLPFSKERISCPSPTLRALPDLALASVDKEMEDKKFTENKENTGKVGNGGVTIEQAKGACNSTEGQINSNNPTNNTHRKARRCWSPDLHRRFVNALQMLGGSQVATPKQIRELMKVDGLTNDEVKSHLQKYRLHTRRPSPSPQAPGTAAAQLVVLGGIWVPPEYATAAAAAHNGAPTLYNHHPSPHTPTHFCAASPVPQDFYTPSPSVPPLPPPHHQMHHHNLQNQLHLYRSTSQGHNSPDSDLREAGDRSESIEDGKSESSS
ncbi:myb family transcription factor EFM-like [Mangifera indica]|uniref:myb family transcription factor EFM-like n=1 Tax=Mangifera indica TaxID=29780 RepID=UPI001CFA54B4|nr:myb family transcription factor EFM-like [Mangifera indica]